ncbi:Fc.00g111810.m01.CDS01 [Cosmosporella sp. VM-42]
MPRPRRARRAPTKAKAQSPAENASDSDEARPAPGVTRGRRRTTRSTGSRLSVADEQAIISAERSRDAALERLADEDPTTTSGNAVDDEESGGSVEIGRRVMSTPAQRRDTTGLDLADDMFGDLDDSFEDGDIPRGAQSDTSSLNLSMFKRRPRASSIIGRNDPPIRPSSRGGNTPSISTTLNLGVFKRRAREPSILGTSRKPRPEDTITVPSSESESEEDFAPEAESTPLNRRRTRPAPESVAESDIYDASPRASISRKLVSKKRKSEDAVISSDRPEKISRIESDEEEDPGQVADSDSDSSLSSLSSPRGPSPVLPARPVTPVNDDEIMAPPASSGSEDANEIWPDIHTLAKRRRRPSVTTPIRAEEMSDVSSPPSLTHSPNYVETKAPRTRGRATTRRQASPKVTTADLTSMLPKRRYKKVRDPFNLDSEEELDNSGLGQDEDELSYLDTRAARRRKGSRPPSRGGSRPASRGGRAAHSALKPRQVPPSNAPAARDSRTYSRRSSDKENEGDDNDDDDEHEESRFDPLPDETFESPAEDSGNTPSADELKQAAKKFKEVDQWSLEFEEVTQSSSPAGAR